MDARYKSAGNTGAIFVPGEGVGSAFMGATALPRSIASDGRRWILSLHVLVHVVALVFNVVSCVFFWGDFPQSQMRTIAVVSVCMHAAGILGLLALASTALKQVAYTLFLSLVYSFLLSALLATAVEFVLTCRSDDVLTESHWALYVSGYFQTLGLGFLVACSLNMAAHGDNAIDAKAAEGAAA